jgi:hypothetical protein
MWLPWVPWDVAAGAAAVLLGAGRWAGRGHRPAPVPRVRPWLTELGLVSLLYAISQEAARLSLLQTPGAAARGLWIWRAERVLRLPSEAALQRLFLPHPALVRILDAYYVAAHVPALAVALVRKTLGRLVESEHQLSRRCETVPSPPAWRTSWDGAFTSEPRRGRVP